MSNPIPETNASVFPKMTNADLLMMITLFSAVICFFPLTVGTLFNDAILLTFGFILLFTFVFSIPFTVRLSIINSNRLKEASKKIVDSLELEYGIKISPTEQVFYYDAKVELTSRDILGTDSNGESILVALRADDTGSKVVPFVIRNAVKVSQAS